MQFERRMVIMNQYDEVVCELENVGGLWRVPTEEQPNLCNYLDEGDVYRVVCIETEV